MVRSGIHALRYFKTMTQDQKSLQFLKYVHQNEDDGGMWRHPVPVSRGMSVEQHFSNVKAITKPYKALLSLTDSQKATDLDRLLRYLVDQGFIEKKYEDLPFIYYGVTSEGIMAVENIGEPYHDSRQVFVAMWFDGELEDVYERGFEPAIVGAGYSPYRIDKDNFSEKIDDKIISEILRSRFIVADFSKGKDGARGSVYYEAGFAHGLGREVIFTCREKDIEDVHFDTRQYPHIVWRDADHLREKLTDAINARIDAKSSSG